MRLKTNTYESISILQLLETPLRIPCPQKFNFQNSNDVIIIVCSDYFDSSGDRFLFLFSTFIF